MLDDPRAIEIISQAKQANVAQPARSSRDFEAVFEDFFAQVPAPDGLAGQRILDLGPGQYDFARRARERGADCENADVDPAVLELGRYLGFTVHEANFKKPLAAQVAPPYHAVFCKFSINALWFREAGLLQEYIVELDGMIREGGWGWITPWNGRPKQGVDDVLAAELLQAQREAFVRCGWQAFDLSDALVARYGIGGRVENHVLFMKNLPAPEALRA